MNKWWQLWLPQCACLKRHICSLKILSEAARPPSQSQAGFWSKSPMNAQPKADILESIWLSSLKLLFDGPPGPEGPAHLIRQWKMHKNYKGGIVRNLRLVKFRAPIRQWKMHKNYKGGIVRNLRLVKFRAPFGFMTFLKKGAQIKSYLISHALMKAGFKMWNYQLKICTTTYNEGLLYWHYVNLFYGIVKIYLIRILCQSTAGICVFTASTRCVFKIYNVTRLKCCAQIFIS